MKCPSVVCGGGACGMGVALAMDGHMSIHEWLEWVLGLENGKARRISSRKR